jgi:hypothetical protein
MTPVRRWPRAVGLVAVVVALLGVAPLVAVAADEDPQPTEWPTVRTPTEGGADQSDPEPAKLPTVKNADSVGDEDPGPTKWPAPTEN